MADHASTSKASPLSSGPSQLKQTRQNPHEQGAHATTPLHYNKAALLADYRDTYNVFIKMLLVGVGGAMAYFFALMIYLGGWGHTHSDDYAKEFNDRYPMDYAGQKLPMFGGPATPPETETEADTALASEKTPATANSAPVANTAPADTSVSAAIAANPSSTQSAPVGSPVTVSATPLATAVSPAEASSTEPAAAR